MDSLTKDIINISNPWLKTDDYAPLLPESFQPRTQLPKLLASEWDEYCTVLIGPRQAGKTTLGKALCHHLITVEQRFTTLFYLNCDFKEIRAWLKNITFIQDLEREFNIHKAIIFIDEVQRLEDPGLLLKSIIDLKSQFKLIASGSSQLELKSKLKEYLTGRKIESMVLPISRQEDTNINLNSWLVYGSYPKVVQTNDKRFVLESIYNYYINKDIIEILKVGKPAVLEQLIALIAHSSGQIVNEYQFSIDCKVSNSVISNYLHILEYTYVLAKITPFAGKLRTEITSRPKYFFIDNGFRNYVLHNFIGIENRVDIGALVEGAIFQELLKYKVQHYLDYKINFWRTKANAEVDFVISHDQQLLPIEAKYRNYKRFTLNKGFRSFIDAYRPHHAIVITKNFSTTQEVNGCLVHMIPLSDLDSMFTFMDKIFL